MGRRYPSYRGRKRKWPAVLAALLVLSVAVVCGVFWVMENIYLDADGTVHIRLPGQSGTPSPLPLPSEEINPDDIIVIPPSTAPSPSPSPAPSPSPSPAPETKPAVMFVPRAVTADTEALLTLKARAEALGCTVLALEYKAEDGVLMSEEEVAAVRAVLGDGFAYAAYMAMFRDQTMPSKRGTWGVKTGSGVNWINKEGRWLNPFAEPVREYLLDCVRDADTLGFDILLLDRLCFPYTGSTNKINYGDNSGDSHIEAVNAFAGALASLDLDAALWLKLEAETAMTGPQELAGQDLTALQEYFSVLFAEDNGEAALPSGVLPVWPDAERMPGAEGWFLRNADGVY